MSLVTRVKVGNITSLSEARYCAGMGVDFLGFRIGSGGLAPQTYQDIINWISVPHLVLEAHRDASITLEEITTHYPGHYIEINKDQLAWLDSSYSFIVHVSAVDWPSVSGRLNGRKNVAFVELAPLGSGVPAISTFPLMMRIGSLEELDQAMHSPVAAISIDGSPESKPGIMDYGLVGEVLEVLSGEG